MPRSPFGRLAAASEFDAEAVEFLPGFDGLIPVGMTTLIGGRPGHGKSLWVAWLVAQVSQRHHVITSNLEDHIETMLIPRLRAAGAKMKNVHLLSMDDPLALPEQTGELEAMIAHYGAPLVCMDPLSQHLTVSIYNGQEVRKAMGPLNALAQRQNVAILAVHHTVKYTRSVDHALQAFGGDMGGLPGAVRVAYVLGRHPRDAEKLCLAWAKINFAKEPPTQEYLFDTREVYDNADRLVAEIPCLVPAPEVDEGEGGEESSMVTALELVQHRDGKKGDNETHGRPRLEEAAAFLENYLCLGAQPERNVMEDAVRQGITIATLRRAKKEVGVISAREGFGGGTCGDCNHPWKGGKARKSCANCKGTNRVASKLVWSLPPDHPSLLEEEEA